MNRWTMFFIPVLTLITNTFATDVGGVISVNTVWTVSNSPYIVKSNLLLEAGAELIIEPGVEIKFEPSVGLWIYGTFKAQGTAESRILFTSNNSSPQRGDWRGVLFGAEDSYIANDKGSYLSGSILNFCTIEYAAPLDSQIPAIKVNNSSVYIENLILRHTGSNRGLDYTTAKQTNTIIKNCEFIDIYGSNMLFNSGKASIIKCNFEGGAGFGPYSWGLNNITNVDSCNFRNCTYEGMGTNIKKDGILNVTNCSFCNNKTGLTISCALNWENNSLRISNSSFYGNDVGINIINWYETIQDIRINLCNIYENNIYQIKTEYSNNQRYVDATNNWWGLTDEIEIEKGIYDFYDDFTLSKIFYKPYKTSPILYFALNANATNGNIKKDPDQSSYSAGSLVTLTASPDPGYTFVNWSGDASGSTNPLTITMDANKTITATFEHDQSNPVVKVNLRAILQGYYDANLDQMSTLLNAGSFLPQNSPYCEDQCSVGSIPIDVTDWVLVQLLNSVSDAPLVSKSAFLRRDGYLVGTNGNIGINVEAQPGNYFVGLVHRNHLTVMTSSAITLNTNEGILYDFSTSADKCYGGNSSVEVEPGIWGMWAGDINHDGNITTKDYTIWYEADRRDLAGYQLSDVNGDTNVDDLDYSIWLSNAQKSPTSTATSYSECYIVTDIDGNAYKTVKIGNQWWMAENLKVTHYRNGENILNVTVASEWATLATGAYCNYNNDAGNIATYGRLYNWYSLHDSRGLAPEGWHIPNDGEWQVLVDYLGGNAIAGGKIKESGTSHWASPNTGATDDYGFCAVPNGYRNFDGIFYDMGISAPFWNSTAYNSGNSLGWYPRYEYAIIFRDHHPVTNGFAVRCVKD